MIKESLNNFYQTNDGRFYKQAQELIRKYKGDKRKLELVRGSLVKEWESKLIGSAADLWEAAKQNLDN